MLDNAFRGGARYWSLIGFWVLIILIGLASYGRQLTEGLTVTGMSRDVAWGLYISQFTFLGPWLRAMSDGGHNLLQ